MYRDFILQNFTVILLAAILVFMIIKAILVFSLSIDEDFFGSLLRLFFIQDKEAIKNSIGRTKKLYKRSNLINRVFYLLLVLFLVAYWLMTSI